MFKIISGMLCLILAVFFGTPIMVSGGEPEDIMRLPLGKIIIKPPKSITPRRPPSFLTHSRHFGYKCSQCHHTWEYNTQIKACKASGCHELTAAPKKSKKNEPEPPPMIMYYMRAYHKQCIICHLGLKRDNLALEMSFKVLKEKLPPTGPTGCIQCHPKEEE